MNMRVNLRGMFKNIADEITPSRRSYHQHCLDEVYAHIQGVIDGQYTLKEFAEHYCIKESAPASKDGGGG